jgi:hypothetical protein
MTTRRGAPAPIAVSVTAITAVRIAVTFLVVAKAPTAVTVTIAAIFPGVTTISGITALPATIVGVTVRRTAVPHVLARCRGMGPISHGIVDADPAAIQILWYQNKIRSKNLENFSEQKHAQRHLIH